MSYPATMTFQRLGRAGSGGFTLIELLIALTVLSLLVGVLFAGLRMGDRAWSAVFFCLICIFKRGNNA